MRTVIYKYTFNGEGDLKVPAGKVLHVDSQHNGAFPTIWVEHSFETMNTHDHQRYTIVGTGGHFDNTRMKHVGTAICGPFVWHVYEVQQ